MYLVQMSDTNANANMSTRKHVWPATRPTEALMQEIQNFILLVLLFVLAFHQHELGQRKLVHKII